jgi:hypothetical protein
MHRNQGGCPFETAFSIDSQYIMYKISVYSTLSIDYYC